MLLKLKDAVSKRLTKEMLKTSLEKLSNQYTIHSESSGPIARRLSFEGTDVDT